MKANKLRIGNLLMVGESPIEVCSYSKDNFSGRTVLAGDEKGKYYYSLDHEIKPIPLTEEWLIKFGFKKGVKTTTEYTTKIPFKIIGNWANKLLWYELDHCGNAYQPDSDWKLYKVYNGARTEIFGSNPFSGFHVHQLQNLYHSLTGEELIVNNLVKNSPN